MTNKTIIDNITIPRWLFLLCVLGGMGLGFAVGVTVGARGVVLQTAPEMIPDDIEREVQPQL